MNKYYSLTVSGEQPSFPPIQSFCTRLVLGWLTVMAVAVAPESADATPLLQVELAGEDLLTGDTFVVANPPTPMTGQVGGTVFETHPLGGTFGINGAPLIQGYSDDTGTFWAEARTGIDPYEARGRVRWQESYFKQSPDDAIDANLTGGHITLTDFGGHPDFPSMTGSIDFTLFLSHVNSGEVTVFEHEAEVTGSNGAWTLTQDRGDFEGNTSFTTLNTAGGTEDDTAKWQLEPFTLVLFLNDPTIPVGDEFRVTYSIGVHVQGKGGETSAWASFRDPISMTGGITITPRGPIPVPEPQSLLLLIVLGLASLKVRRLVPNGRTSM